MRLQHHVNAHFMIFFFFTCIYYLVDFQHHFTSPMPSVPLNELSPMYVSVATHTLLGDGTVLPRTHLAKVLVATQAILAWGISLSLVSGIQ